MAAKNSKKVFDMSSVLQGAAEKTEQGEARADYGFKRVPISAIAFHPNNDFPMEDLESLATDIQENGLGHNVVVRPYSDPSNPEIKYQMISGERRTRASQMIGHHEIMAKVEELDDLKAEVRLIQLNLQTRQLTPMMLSRKTERLFEIVNQMRNDGIDFGGKKTREVVADMLSQDGSPISKTYVSMVKSFGNLIPEFQSAVDTGKISRDSAYQFAQMSSDVQREVYMSFNAGKDLSADDAKDLKNMIKDSGTNEAIEEMKQKLAEAEEEARLAREEQKSAQSKLSEAETKNKKLTTQLNSAKSEALQEKESHNKKIEALRDEIAVMKGNNPIVSPETEAKIKQLETKISEAEKKLSEKYNIEGNKTIVALAQQAKRTLMLLMEEMSKITADETFVLSAEAKKALAEINEFEPKV